MIPQKAASPGETEGCEQSTLAGAGDKAQSSNDSVARLRLPDALEDRLAGIERRLTSAERQLCGCAVCAQIVVTS